MIQEIDICNLRDVQYDRLLLLEESMDRDYESFVDSKTGLVFDEWLVCRDIGPIGSRVAGSFEKILETSVSPRYYIQRKGMRLPFHCDRGTMCAVNLILNESQDTIEFRVNDRIYENRYESALIDTQTEHQVVTVKGDRILFKMSILDKSFNDCREAYVRYRKTTTRA